MRGDWTAIGFVSVYFVLRCFEVSRYGTMAWLRFGIPGCRNEMHVRMEIQWNGIQFENYTRALERECAMTWHSIAQLILLRFLQQSVCQKKRGRGGWEASVVCISGTAARQREWRAPSASEGGRGCSVTAADLADDGGCPDE